MVFQSSDPRGMMLLKAVVSVIGAILAAFSGDGGIRRGPGKFPVQVVPERPNCAVSALHMSRTRCSGAGRVAAPRSCACGAVLCKEISDAEERKHVRRRLVITRTSPEHPDLTDSDRVFMMSPSVDVESLARIEPAMDRRPTRRTRRVRHRRPSRSPLRTPADTLR